MRSSDSYIIRGGEIGAERLEILTRATWPFSRDFFKKNKVQYGSQVLELGCGAGAISERVAELIGQTGYLLGADIDEVGVKRAQEKFATDAKSQYAFLRLDLTADETFENSALKERSFDFVYVRFVLSHLREPKKLLENIHKVMKPGAVLLVEDVDFDGHYSTPQSNAFDRYVSLYIDMGKRKGANPLIGPELSGLLQAAGFKNVSSSSVVPAFSSGDGKWMAYLTFHAIQQTLLNDGLITQDEAKKVLSELELLSQDPNATMSLPRFFQVSGTR